jgi:outer membrane protein assembly factor BamB
MTHSLCLALVLLLALLQAQPAPDWPMWGGTPQRNMVSPAKGLPTSWSVEPPHNLRWRAQLGSETNGTPVVAAGKVFVGTNNNHPRNPAIQGDRSVLMAFRATDGAFLWQAVSEKLSPNRDWPLSGICSSPLVEGNRLYYVTNRAELVALDTAGAGASHPTDAAVIWKLDMAAELGVVPHFQAASSPVSYGDLLLLNTSNGFGEKGAVAAPGAPSFLAVNKHTGKVVWSDSSPGGAILDGQWSSPAVGVVGGVSQAVFGGGDGWLYSFEAATGKLLWKLDGNESAAPEARGFFVSTAVFEGDRVYVGLGQNPQDGAKPGRFFAIDARLRGDITRTGILWRYDKLSRTISTAAVADGRVYISDFRGILHCLAANTGKPLWVYDTFAAIWGSPLVADGKVYVANEDGDVTILAAGAELKKIAQIQMGHAVYTTPVPAGGLLFIATKQELVAIAP